MEPLQRCPGCKKNLTQKDYQNFAWGIKGERCRECRSKKDRDYHIKNPEKRRINRQRWEAKQPVGFQRYRSLKRKYGITKREFDEILERQKGKCLGCLKELTVTKDGSWNHACVDHDHNKGVVRGILCDTCNRALGYVKENKETLTRLRLYLDYDRSKKMVYIIGALKNKKVLDVAEKLTSEGFEAIDNWMSAGPDADTCWQEYEQSKGKTYAEALKGRSAQNVFYFDKSLIDLSDYGVLVMPSGRSGHLELGYMAGQGKPAFILLDKEPDRYDVMPQFASGVFSDIEDLIKELHNIRL